VVKIVDLSGAVTQQASPNNPSALGEAAVSTPPNMMSGFTDGPNLIGFSIDTTNSTATYKFDSQYGALARNNGQPVPDDFGLLYADGTNSIDLASYPSQATFTGPNQVTVQFNPNQIKNVVGGIIGTADPDEPFSCQTNSSPCDGSYAVQDFQFKGNVAPLTSGIGTASSSTTSSSTTTTSRTTSRSSTSTTTPPPRKRLGRLLLVGRRLKVSHRKVAVSFKCDSSRSCFGLFSITYHVRSKHHRTVTAVCTVSRSAKYSIPAHKTRTVHVPVHGYCVAAVRRHHGHLGGKLTTRPRTNQAGVVKKVTLV